MSSGNGSTLRSSAEPWVWQKHKVQCKRIFISKKININTERLKVNKREKVKSLSHVRLFATLCTVAYQVPPSMGFSMQEYWSGGPFPFPGVLPDPGIKPGSPPL